MKSKKVLRQIIVCLLATVLIVSTLGFAGCGPTEKSKTIAVVAKGESHAFWQSVKKGAEAAGEKYGYKITFVGPKGESPENIPQQKEQVTTALANNPAGLALATIGTGFNDLLTQAFDKKIPVVHFDSGIKPEDIATIDKAGKNPIVSKVATSDNVAAATVATNFYAAIKAEIPATGYKVGIIQHDTTNTGIDRTKGFKDKFEALAKADGKTVEIIVEIKAGDSAGIYKEALEALDQKGVKTVYMTNEGVVKQVYDAITAAGAKYDAFKFCGYDAGDKQMEWMKKTTGAKLIGSVAQDSYQIGFQAVEQVVNAIEGKTVTKDVAIGGTWWNASNIDELLASGILYKG